MIPVSPFMGVFMNETQHTDRLSSRLNTWEHAISDELTELLRSASEYHTLIATAKTTAKKAYFQKKLQKVRTSVLQMIAAKERVTGNRLSLSGAEANGS